MYTNGVLDARSPRGKRFRIAGLMGAVAAGV
jgi:hypothetical protein